MKRLCGGKGGGPCDREGEGERNEREREREREL